MVTPEKTWAVWRQDDNGNRFFMSGGHTKAKAEQIAREFEARGHKQFYWVEEEEPPRVQLQLWALEPELYNAWQDVFSDCEDVSCHHGDILQTSATALVSPANSFGYMDGGFDLKISQKLGWEVEGRVRAQILEHHDGELPVGSAVIVETGYAELPLLICAPTMRVPMDVSKTVNAYLAFRGVLRAVAQRGDISSIACPGLGTGEGRMPVERCAAQMRYAYDVVVRRQLETQGGLAGAVRNHMWLLE